MATMKTVYAEIKRLALRILLAGFQRTVDDFWEHYPVKSEENIKKFKKHISGYLFTMMEQKPESRIHLADDIEKALKSLNMGLGLDRVNWRLLENGKPLDEHGEVIVKKIPLGTP